MNRWLLVAIIAVAGFVWRFGTHVRVDKTLFLNNVKGKTDLAGKDIHLLRIPFETAKIELSKSPSRKLTWDCMSTSNMVAKLSVNAGVATLNLSPLSLAKCLVTLPAGVATEVRGVNGHMEVRHPDSALDIQLNNGKVRILADPTRVYDFDVNVKNGLQDFFPRSSSQDAVKVKVKVVNGSVSKE